MTFFSSGGAGFGGRSEEVPVGLGQQGVWMDDGVLPHRSKLRGDSGIPDLLKECSGGPAHLLPPQGALSPPPPVAGWFHFPQSPPSPWIPRVGVKMRVR